MLNPAQTPRFVTVGSSSATDASTAVQEALAPIDIPGSCFILAFAPTGLNVHELADALGVYANGIPVFGCTTAGQITPRGYEADVLLLLAFPKRHFHCASILFEPLRPYSATDVAEKAEKLANGFRHTAGWSRLGLVLSDGLSKQEDVLISTLETVLTDLPIFGGSAGDGLLFEETFVLHNSKAHQDAALLLLIETNLRFHGIGFDHFLPRDAPLIITAADPEERLVYEINGAPASLEYARLVGVPVEQLNTQIFAENPLLLQHDRLHYVRAISDAKDDNALSFLAAIDDGLIMTLGDGQEILETLSAGLDLKETCTQEPDFILGFDCVLRRLEIEHKQLGTKVSQILSDRRVFGFNTYGEQQSGLHMNQTFVGVAFIEPEAWVLN